MRERWIGKWAMPGFTKLLLHNDRGNEMYSDIRRENVTRPPGKKKTPGQRTDCIYLLAIQHIYYSYHLLISLGLNVYASLNLPNYHLNQQTTTFEEFTTVQNLFLILTEKLYTNPTVSHMYTSTHPHTLPSQQYPALLFLFF